MAARGARAAGGEAPDYRVLGFVHTYSQGHWKTAFVQRLGELGWVEGRNVAIEYRWAEGRSQRYTEIAAEYVRLGVDVIVTSGTGAVAAAKQATSVIPIVFATAGDPVGAGLVTSLARPGGNVTGLSLQQTDLAAKRLELLREAVPLLRRLGILGNVASAGVLLEMREAEATARMLGIEATTLEIRPLEEIAPGIEAFKDRVEALDVVSDPLIFTHRARIHTLAMSARLPTIYGYREYVEAGGLISYGPNLSDLYRRAGDYVDRILRGTKPSEIPIEQPTKFDFVINLTTAKALGLTVPATLLARADEVLE